ncbi:UDP-glycosyltransferase [Antarcticibacterium flavum]|uniref:UDP-glycosyltransferase n=1 Tax=Antarcticibacterium flavum TaxID=2058175 RepID=A0A5B7X7G5_9FLAO|nr:MULTISPECIES: UDP-glycosyltransferase [Antarcticibacterium]MCM4161416.1 UDP-glycosyltransferase [Antarcticibacterium sp. W02-3]QCY70561.1 UDP-glycosyltransferase [Antarcticibacterium flavum]
MPTKKVLILLPDGLGLRNFAFTSFVEMGEQRGWDVVFWNHTAFDLTALGLKEIKLSGKARAKTDLLKRAKIEVELDHFTTKFGDTVYQDYKFPAYNKGLKAKLKNQIVNSLVRSHQGEKGLQQLRKALQASERRGSFYRNCKQVLEEEKPDFVFCTNQRPVNAIAPLTAAQDLGIPTASFIFSWDNLPKATMVVQPDHYFVWSEYMKKELLSYYPQIGNEQIHITGSPQFEPHFDLSLRQSREEFFYVNGLDSARKYICFSGDDVTTSPYDHQYLDYLAGVVKLLNNKGYNLGIIFRRCPVDFTDRYQQVLGQYKDLIVPVAPKWEKTGKNWSTVFPTKEDLSIQINTILHSEMVVNLGSSMVFDFAIFKKPCLYVNYEPKNKDRVDWSVKKIYNFVHFRSMPTGEEVFWLDSKREMALKIEMALTNPAPTVEKAMRWFEKINQPPAGESSGRIWDAINGITKNE